MLLRNVLQQLATANAISNSLIHSTLMMETMRFSECRLLHEPHGLISQKTEFVIVTAVKLQIVHSINRLGSVAET
jgi:hypothetical protein